MHAVKSLPHLELEGSSKLGTVKLRRIKSGHTQRSIQEKKGNEQTDQTLVLCALHVPESERAQKVKKKEAAFSTT